MSISFTVNKNIGLPVHGSFTNSWDQPVNANWSSIDDAFGGVTTISVTGVAAGTYPLTIAQYQPPNIIFTGTLSANLVYIIPSGVGGMWSVFNNVTAFGVGITFASGGGGSLVCPQGVRTLLICDGTNVQLAQSLTTGANPSASVGLTAVNGSAATFIRSDGAPALSQAITPTWTGEHTFTATTVFNGEISGTTAVFADEVQFQSNALALTRSPGDNTTNIATTAFVATSYAPLFSPALTGDPTGVTALPGNSTIALATTAFVNPGSSFVTNGYRKNPDGSIDQWGTHTQGSSPPDTVTFPIAFPTACLIVMVTPSAASETFYATIINASTFELGYGANGQVAYWRALGY